MSSNTVTHQKMSSDSASSNNKDDESSSSEFVPDLHTNCNDDEDDDMISMGYSEKDDDDDDELLPSALPGNEESRFDDDQDEEEEGEDIIVHHVNMHNDDVSDEDSTAFVDNISSSASFSNDGENKRFFKPSRVLLKEKSQLESLRLKTPRSLPDVRPLVCEDYITVPTLLNQLPPNKKIRIYDRKQGKVTRNIRVKDLPLELAKNASYEPVMEQLNHHDGRGENVRIFPNIEQQEKSNFNSCKSFVNKRVKIVNGKFKGFQGEFLLSLYWLQLCFANGYRYLIVIIPGHVSAFVPDSKWLRISELNLDRYCDILVTVSVDDVELLRVPRSENAPDHPFPQKLILK